MPDKKDPHAELMARVDWYADTSRGEIRNVRRSVLYDFSRRLTDRLEQAEQEIVALTLSVSNRDARIAEPASGDPSEPRDDSDRTYTRPIGYLAAYELGRLASGHNANLRSAKFGPSPLDCDVPVYLDAPLLADAANALLHQIDIRDFADSNGHSAKMLKPVHDLMKLLAATQKDPS